MNRITTLLASAAFALTASSAIAADAIVPYEEPAPVYGVYDWTGFYLGIQGGYVWTKASQPGGSDTFDGPTLGVHAGYNFQNGNWVFGVEGDVGYTWNERSFGADDVGTDWQGSLRGRVGYAIDRTLIYGTGGLAFTNVYVDNPGGSLDDTLFGWTLGAGIEHAFTDNWSARIEYRYSDFGEFTPNGVRTGIDFTEHALRIGVSFKF